MTLGSPADMFIIPDHYVFRMLYSQGINLEDLGVPRTDGGAVETDHRKIWQLFADHFYLFRATPTGLWLNDELHTLFGISKKLTSETAQEIYEEVEEKLTRPEFKPRALYENFNVEILCTTDSATDDLAHHREIRASGWKADIRPTFRPDAVVQLLMPGWHENIDKLGELTGEEISGFKNYITALESRREAFKALGATATDHGCPSPYTEELSENEAEEIFQRALSGRASEEDSVRFTAHMLMEMARMSTEDGLVMQLHPGSFRNHNHRIFERFGADKGCDIPAATEYTGNLRPLLERFGNDKRLTLILFTLDETSYSRELAPLAGHYPALRLGPPWWFFDSVNGMERYFDMVVETAGIYNTAGFNDDTRALPSIPARHDVWRRASCNWLSGLVVRGMLDTEDAVEMAHSMAYGLAREAYRL
jgi:glucuronate isomerase